MGLVTPDWGTLFWMSLVFLIVFFLLKRYAWKPVLGMLQAREDSIAEALDNAKEAREGLGKLHQESERTKTEARREREQILKEAREIKNHILEEARGQAMQEKARILEEARRVIEREKADALQDIRDTAAVCAVRIAEQLLKRELRIDEVQQRLITDSLHDIRSS